MIAAIGLIGARTYWLWKEGPWDLPNPLKVTVAASDEESKPEAKSPPLVNTEAIIGKNLFDPERGAGQTREAEANSRAFQRIRSMVLLGTAILGNSRFAILQDPGSSPAVPGTPGPTSGPMRVKLGDTVEGFRLSEIADKRVVFTRGASRVEVALDYFRKVETVEPRVPVAAQPGTPGAVVPRPGPVVPRVVPNLPRRERLPVPPGQESNQ